MGTLPQNVAAEILSQLRQEGFITELDAQQAYDGPPTDVAEYLSGLTAEGIAQYTPYSDGGSCCHAYMHLGGRDPIAWDHCKGLDELKARAAR
jgi:hypothetical protein